MHNAFMRKVNVWLPITVIHLDQRCCFLLICQGYKTCVNEMRGLQVAEAPTWIHVNERMEACDKVCIVTPLLWDGRQRQGYIYESGNTKHRSAVIPCLSASRRADTSKDTHTMVLQAHTEETRHLLWGFTVLPSQTPKRGHLRHTKSNRELCCPPRWKFVPGFPLNTRTHITCWKT